MVKCPSRFSCLLDDSEKVKTGPDQTMGKYSDAEEEKKKRKKKKKRRSRSASSEESRTSTKHKKSKKKHKRKSRSRSKSTSRGYRSRSTSHSRRSRSRSKDRYSSRRRSRSDSRDRRRRSRSYDRRSRSRSRGRYSRSRSRSYDKSYRRSRRSRSDDRSRSRYDSRSPSRVKVKKEKTDDLCASIPGFSSMSSADQANVRLQMALKAAAAADEKIREQMQVKQQVKLEDSLRFSSAVQDIESDSFIQATFRSKKSDTQVDGKKEEISFGTAAEFKPDMVPKKALVIDPTKLAHPSLYVDPDEKMDKWVLRLIALRKRKLEGEAIS